MYMCTYVCIQHHTMHQMRVHLRTYVYMHMYLHSTDPYAHTLFSHTRTHNHTTCAAPNAHSTHLQPALSARM